MDLIKSFDKKTIDVIVVNETEEYQDFQFGIESALRFVQSKNAFLSILITVSGIISLPLNPEHLENADSPISVTV